MCSNFVRIFVLLFTANCFLSVFCGVANRSGAATSQAPATDPPDGRQLTAPWVNSNKFQGDIDGYDQTSFDALVGEIADWQTRRDNNKNNNSTLESAISDPRGLWTNGIVPYVIESSDPKVQTAVLAAIKDYHDSTCIKFVERTTQPDYIKIIDTKGGCWSKLGNKRNGAQELNLGPGCKTKGTAIHELMHALGFWHEQQRYDRDDNIIVYSDNIQKGEEDQYKKANNKNMKLIGNYDMDSVMHYPSWGFALPGKITMKAKNSDRTNFGGEEITKEDIRKLRMLYNCADDMGSETSIVSGAAYYIKPSGTNNCLDVPGTSKEVVQLQQWDCNHTPAQQWIIDHVKENIYSIKNVGSGNVMDVLSTEVDNEGGQVVQYPPWSPVSIHQQFVLTPKEGHFHMTSVVNGRIIWPDVKGQVRHWKFDAGQNWALEKVQ